MNVDVTQPSHSKLTYNENTYRTCQQTVIIFECSACSKVFLFGLAEDPKPSKQKLVHFYGACSFVVDPKNSLRKSTGACSIDVCDKYVTS